MNAKAFILGLPKNRYQTALLRLGLTRRGQKITSYTRGHVVRYDFCAKVCARPRFKDFYGYLAVWFTVHPHLINVLKIEGMVYEASPDADYLLRLLAYCKQFVLPKTEYLPEAAASLLAQKMIAQWKARNASASGLHAESAKEFITRRARRDFVAEVTA